MPTPGEVLTALLPQTTLPLITTAALLDSSVTSIEGKVSSTQIP